MFPVTYAISRSDRLALVSTGACLFTLVSIFGFRSGDPARLAAQIVSGIGFLGAGIIFRSGDTVRGLTTAISVWLVAAIGLATGAGMYVVAGFATLIGLVILHLFPGRSE